MQASSTRERSEVSRRPGWYEDPDGGSGGRFWDGEEWTDRSISQLPEQGWYPNPEGENDRYWDGHDWTSITKASGYTGRQSEVPVGGEANGAQRSTRQFSDRTKMAIAVLAFFVVVGIVLANTGKAKLQPAHPHAGQRTEAGLTPTPRGSRDAAKAHTPTTRGAASSATTVAPAGPIGSYNGSGDDVLKLEVPLTAMNLVYASSQANSNFVLIAQDSAGQAQGLLVNTVGAYRGTTAFTGKPATYIAVRASGPWHIEIKSLKSARSWDGRGPLIGAGDDVVIVPGGTSSYRPVKFSFSGQGNFIVQSYGMNGAPNLLVNAMGGYTGTVGMPRGTKCLVVRAPSPWTGTPSS